jgi:hypothetical protein
METAKQKTLSAAKRAHTAYQPTGEWCRKDKRLAIHLRDGLACVWCGATLEDGMVFSLDHAKPKSKGGSNDGSNLISACLRCNSSRGSRSMAAFARAVAAYLNHGTTAKQILDHVKACLRRAVPRDEAKAMLARRGSVAAAIKAAPKKLR